MIALVQWHDSSLHGESDGLNFSLLSHYSVTNWCMFHGRERQWLFRHTKCCLMLEKKTLKLGKCF